MTDPPHRYEITFDVLGQRRDEYERWLETHAIDWLAHETVAEFEMYHNDQGLSPELKFAFGFDSLQAWAAFVSSDEHEAATETLETVTERLDGQLWQRDSLSLNAGSTMADGGHPGHHEIEHEIRSQTS